MILFVNQFPNYLFISGVQQGRLYKHYWKRNTRSGFPSTLTACRKIGTILPC